MYQNGDVVNLNKLYVTNDNGVMLNRNLKFREHRRYDNPEEGTDQIMLIPREGSTTVIDRGGQSVKDYEDGVSAWFVYGLKEFITEDLLLSDYIDVQGNGRIEVIPQKPGSFSSTGTGTIIKVYDNSTNELVEKLYVVIYGDLNGDARIASTDAAIATDASRETEETHWQNKNHPDYNPAKVKACDINHSGNLDETNIRAIITAISDVSLSVGYMDQVNGVVVKP